MLSYWLLAISYQLSASGIRELMRRSGAGIEHHPFLQYKEAVEGIIPPRLLLYHGYLVILEEDGYQLIADS